MDSETLRHLISVFFVWSYKIASLIIGYLIAKLGHSLLVKGVTGEFKFQSEIKGVKADLVSASPGTFFILLATIIIGISLYKGMNIENTPISSPGQPCAQQIQESDLDKPPLSPLPPIEEKNHEEKVIAR